MKQLVHDNVNQFVGICFDKRSEFYIIWNHCIRGTLADMMYSSAMNGSNKKLMENQDEPSFDNNFKSAFVRDIIRVCDTCDIQSYGIKCAS